MRYELFYISHCVWCVFALKQYSPSPSSTEVFLDRLGSRLKRENKLDANHLDSFEHKVIDKLESEKSNKDVEEISKKEKKTTASKSQTKTVAPGVNNSTKKSRSGMKKNSTGNSGKNFEGKNSPISILNVEFPVHEGQAMLNKIESIDSDLREGHSAAIEELEDIENKVIGNLEGKKKEETNLENGPKSTSSTHAKEKNSTISESQERTSESSEDDSANIWSFESNYQLPLPLPISDVNPSSEEDYSMKHEDPRTLEYRIVDDLEHKVLEGKSSTKEKSSSTTSAAVGSIRDTKRKENHKMPQVDHEEAEGNVSEVDKDAFSDSRSIESNNLLPIPAFDISSSNDEESSVKNVKKKSESEMKHGKTKSETLENKLLDDLEHKALEGKSTSKPSLSSTTSAAAGSSTDKERKNNDKMPQVDTKESEESVSEVDEDDFSNSRSIESNNLLPIPAFDIISSNDEESSVKNVKKNSKSESEMKQGKTKQETLENKLVDDLEHKALEGKSSSKPRSSSTTSAPAGSITDKERKNKNKMIQADNKESEENESEIDEDNFSDSRSIESNNLLPIPAFDVSSSNDEESSAKNVKKKSESEMKHGKTNTETLENKLLDDLEHKALEGKSSSKPRSSSTTSAPAGSITDEERKNNDKMIQVDNKESEENASDVDQDDSSDLRSIESNNLLPIPGFDVSSLHDEESSAKKDKENLESESEMKQGKTKQETLGDRLLGELETEMNDGKHFDLTSSEDINEEHTSSRANDVDHLLPIPEFDYNFPSDLKENIESNIKHKNTRTTGHQKEVKSKDMVKEHRKTPKSTTSLTITTNLFNSTKTSIDRLKTAEKTTAISKPILDSNVGIDKEKTKKSITKTTTSHNTMFTIIKTPKSGDIDLRNGKIETNQSKTTPMASRDKVKEHRKKPKSTTSLTTTTNSFNSTNTSIDRLKTTEKTTAISKPILDVQKTQRKDNTITKKPKASTAANNTTTADRRNTLPRVFKITDNPVKAKERHESSVSKSLTTNISDDGEKSESNAPVPSEATSKKAVIKELNKKDVHDNKTSITKTQMIDNIKEITAKINKTSYEIKALESSMKGKESPRENNTLKAGSSKDSRGSENIQRSEAAQDKVSQRQPPRENKGNSAESADQPSSMSSTPLVHKNNSSPKPGKKKKSNSKITKQKNEVPKSSDALEDSQVKNTTEMVEPTLNENLTEHITDEKIYNPEPFKIDNTTRKIDDFKTNKKKRHKKARNDNKTLDNDEDLDYDILNVLKRNLSTKVLSLDHKQKSGVSSLSFMSENIYFTIVMYFIMDILAKNLLNCI